MNRRSFTAALIALICLPTPSAYAAKRITAERVIDAIIDADIDLLDWTYFNAETDPNHLLGRPGQYVEKVTFWDSRIGNPERGEEAGTVEIFSSEKDLLARMRYIQGIAEHLPIAVQYQFRHKLILLRLNKRFSPKRAAEYEAILRGIK